MVLISHRGNLNGRIEKRENSPEYINEALKLGYDVEIDVWFEYGQFTLGHDFGYHHVDKSFLINSHLWCHAKDQETLRELLRLRMVHCFFHQQDDCTLTSQNMIWCYPGKEITSPFSIILLEEPNDSPGVQKMGYAGICSDYISTYK